MNRPILTISMLVSGREETTEKSLQSIQPLREVLGAEVILTDTGCTPEYINQITKYVDKVLTFTWCNDFAKARNVGLAEARGEWFLYLDDDEWFEDVTPIIDFFQSGEYKKYEQAVYLARNYDNATGTSYTDNWVSRMICLEKDTHFEGRVHEALIPARGMCKKINAFVHHYGYVFASEAERVQHYERNVSILKELIKEEPNNLQWKLQMIKELVNIQNYAELKSVCEQTLFDISDVNETFVNLCRGSFYMGVLAADAYEGNLEHMYNHYQQFTEDKRNPLNVNCALHGFVTKILLGVCVAGFKKENILQTGILMQECARAYRYSFAKWHEMERSEQDEIIAENAVFVNEYVAKNVLEGNVQFHHFDAVTENTKMRMLYSVNENIEQMDYAEMTQILTEFAQANLNYMDYLYTEAAFDGDMEILSQEEKAVLWIANGLSVADEQWKVKLQYIGEAAKVCPMLGDFIKRYMNLLGQELVK